MDKVIHAVIGVIISVAIGGLVLFLEFLGLPTGATAPWWGLGMATAAGFGKEAWDGMGHGTKDLLDALATVAGGAFGAAFVAVIAFLV